MNLIYESKEDKALKKLEINFNPETLFLNIPDPEDNLDSIACGYLTEDAGYEMKDTVKEIISDVFRHGFKQGYNSK